MSEVTNHEEVIFCIVSAYTVSVMCAVLLLWRPLQPIGVCRTISVIFVAYEVCACDVLPICWCSFSTTGIVLFEYLVK